MFLSNAARARTQCHCVASDQLINIATRFTRCNWLFNTHPPSQYIAILTDSEDGDRATLHRRVIVPAARVCAHVGDASPPQLPTREQRQRLQQQQRLADGVFGVALLSSLAPRFPRRAHVAL